MIGADYSFYIESENCGNLKKILKVFKADIIKRLKQMNFSLTDETFQKSSDVHDQIHPMAKLRFHSKLTSFFWVDEKIWVNKYHQQFFFSSCMITQEKQESDIHKSR